MKENSIEEDIKNIEEIIELSKEEIDAKDENITAILDIEDLISLAYILSDYKRVLKENEILKEEKEQAWEEWNNLEQGSYETEQKLKQQIKKLQEENEELKISNKEIDKECSRLEKKEVELINENEHYEDLIYALKTYYDITEEDLEKCMKNDR
nr:MAG TPA: hypothetical protein [Caudoviricetes sp.]